jgi:hypothetical protein
MANRVVTGLAFATGCILALAAAPCVQAQMMGGPPMAPPSPVIGYPPPELVTNGPQPTMGDQSGPVAAQQNVRESQQYEQLLHSNPGFRDARIHKECDPITDPQLHNSCLATFGQ